MNVKDPTSIAIDVVVILSGGVILQFAKLFFRNKIYPLIASKLFKLENEKLIWHFSKQLWGFTWHLFCFILELIVLIPSDFWPSIINPYNIQYGTSLFWQNMGELPSTGIRILYLLQIGYYITDLFYMMIFDRPNDIITMAIHHISSLSLLWMSYLPPTCWKIGSAILIMHEIGDVSIYFCKTLHYAQKDTTANILFVFHIFIWIWSRLIWFPRIIVSLFIDIDNISKVWQVIPCGILLSILLILHIMWTWLMLKVSYKSLTNKGDFADPRDKDNPMMKTQEDENEDVVVEMDEIKNNNKDRTDVIDEIIITQRPPLMTRRSSLIESYIESKENIITPTNS